MINALNQHLSTLSKLISQGDLISTDNQFIKGIESLCFYIKKNNLRVKVECKIFSIPCDQCGEHIRNSDKDQVIALNCKHNACNKECLQKLVKRTNSLWTEYENTKCQTCNKYIIAGIIEESFGGKENFKKILEEYEEDRAAKFDCPLCYITCRVDHGITLDCEHRYDRQCLAILLESSINENRVSEMEISCPICAVSMSNFILQSIVSKNIYKKYIYFTTQKFLPVDEKSTIFYRCDGVDCDYFVYLDETLQIITCEKCKKVCCPICKLDPHLGITCEENNKLIEAKRKEAHDNALEDEFKLAAKALGYKTCPHCKSMCERISGCNFMRCFSVGCAGKKNFCLLCEDPISDYNHFGPSGCFGKSCNTLDARKK